tara:strand:+ start:3787 stop:5751 length:1965 start_codon:yes stop_codon:yes gene_type:complete
MAINKFTTLLDLARQAKIISGETATFDGKIEAGIPFSGYPTGVDTGTTVSLGVVSSEDAVFSGNTGTTVFDVSNTGSTNYDAIFSGYSATTWSNPLFSGNTSGLTLPITPLSASTQIVGPFWTLTQTGMTGDYVIGTQYTGYSVTYSFFNVSQFGTGFTYSGFTTASQENFSAGTLDYKGPLDYISSVEDATIDGRLTTNKLTVTGGASVDSLGYVLTQTGNTGEIGLVFNSASGTTDTNFAISNLTFTGDRIHDTNGFVLSLEDSTSLFEVNLSNATTPIVNLTGDSTSLSQIGVSNPPNGGIVMGHRGVTEASFPGYGKQGDGFIYSSSEQNGLNIISQPGSGTEDYIRLYAGDDANGTIPNLFIEGTGSTKGFIGINTDSPTERLHINGDVRVDGNPAILELYYTSDTKTQIGQNSFGFLLFNRNPTTNEEDAFIANYAPSGNTIFRCGPNGSTVDDVMVLFGSGNTASNDELIFSGDSEPLVYSRGNLEVFGNIGIKQIGSVGGSTAIGIDSNGKLSDSVSDERLKENILPLNNSLNILLQLSGVSYNWINREDSGNDRFYGFIAQQLEKVDNHLTFTSKSSGYMGVRNDAITPLIVESIKEIYNNPSIPNYTPTSSNDTYGNVGNITTDDDYLYIKTNNGWKRTSLQSF